MQTRPPSSPSSAAETLFTPESADSWSGLPVPQPGDDVLIGTTLLDTYKVDRVMGEGGMGRIYEAHHTRIAEKRFAIKVLRSEFVKNPDIRARFEREMEAVASVAHPGVLTIQDVGTTPQQGLPYMVCEHLSGLDLLAYLRRFGALPNDDVVQIGCSIAEALEATHAQGVIHRDLKPSNVFLIGSFEPMLPEWHRVKVIDFGLSRFVGRDDDLTKTGIVMGTPAYMSPEQAQGSRTDHLTDVYGVGAVLYAAATGGPPFREETPQQTLLAVMNRDPVRPRERRPSISEGLEVVIQRAMAKQPGERYPSMTALSVALTNLELGISSPVRRAGARTHEHDEVVRGVRLQFVVLGSFALLLIVAGVASAVSGLMALDGLNLRLTPAESVLLALTLATPLLLLLLLLRRFERRVWKNTAKLAAWLPRLRVPVLAALVAYGFASFAVRLGDEVIARFAFGNVLGRTPGVAWPGWSALLVLLAVLAAVAASVRQRWWQSRRPIRRLLLGPALTTGVLLSSLAIARWGLLWRSGDSVIFRAPPDVSSATSSAELLAPDGSVSTEATDAGLRSALEVPSGMEVEAQPESTLQKSSFSPDAPPTLAPSDAPPTLAPSDAPPTLAPPDVLTAAVAQGTDGLTSLSRVYGGDPEVLKALMLAHASRASGITDAVHTIERLLTVSPDEWRDPDVRYILAKAAGGDRKASRAAFNLMSEGMGPAGPDLLYELMLKRPALAERAKTRLSWASVRKLFSPQLAIAYDLRFAPSCLARLRLLERANAIGDQRSINALSALVSKPPKCGRRGRPPCIARCDREAEQLSRSVDIISHRLRARERAASTN